MVTGADRVPSDALEDAAYLAKSENRVQLLGALASEPYTRRDLDELTGISRTTIDRIVNELEERGWVERTNDGSYTATVTGQLVIAEFTPLLEAMDTIRTLGTAATWLPTEELSIGIRHFSDATVRRSEPNAPFEFVEYLADLVWESTTFRILTFLAPPTPVGEAMQDGVVDGRLTAEHVFAGGLVEYLRDQRHHPPDWRDYIEAGARIYHHPGHIPCNLFIVDETVLIMNDHPEGGGAAIESKNEIVYAEAVELFETYREDAVPVDAEVFG